jgi:peptidoglycan/LPS O-acetylase OafA/YrhL
MSPSASLCVQLSARSWARSTPWAAAASALSFVLLGLTVMSMAYTNCSGSARALRGNDVSFGVYIYHMLVINAFAALGWTGSVVWLPVVFALVLLAAAGSWALVERPALRAKRRVRQTPSLAALTAVQLT